MQCQLTSLCQVKVYNRIDKFMSGNQEFRKKINFFVHVRVKYFYVKYMCKRKVDFLFGTPSVNLQGKSSHTPAVTPLVRVFMLLPLPTRLELTCTSGAVINQVRSAMLRPLPTRSEQTYNRHYLLGQSRHASAVTNQVRACNFYLRMSPKVNQRCKKE